MIYEGARFGLVLFTSTRCGGVQKLQYTPRKNEAIGAVLSGFFAYAKVNIPIHGINGV